MDDNYLSSEDMVRRARESASGQPPPAPVDRPEVPDDEHTDGLAEALRREAEAGAPDPFATRAPDPFRKLIPPPGPASSTTPPDDPYDPVQGPSVGDDRLVDWSKDQQAPPSVGKRVGGALRRARPLVGLGVIVLFVGSAFFVRNDTSLEDLQIGDCFDSPGPEVDLIEEIETIPCDRPHDFEVFAQPRRADDLAYPGRDSLFQWADDQCIARFDNYVGTPWEESAIWYTSLVPTAESWEGGDRTVSCMLVQLTEDGQIIQTTGSLRNSGL